MSCLCLKHFRVPSCFVWERQVYRFFLLSCATATFKRLPGGVYNLCLGSNNKSFIVAETWSYVNPLSAPVASFCAVNISLFFPDFRLHCITISGPIYKWLNRGVNKSNETLEAKVYPWKTSTPSTPPMRARPRPWWPASRPQPERPNIILSRVMRTGLGSSSSSLPRRWPKTLRRRGPRGQGSSLSSRWILFCSIGWRIQGFDCKP